MDMRMPVLDGRDATRRIKAEAPGIVVIALTASSFEEQREEILAAGCDDFVRKPFEEGALLHVLAQHLGLEYRYEDGTGAASATPGPDPERLAQLPQGVVERLCRALDHLDVHAIEQALQDVREHDTACADALIPLAKRFDYARMRSLFSRVPAMAEPAPEPEPDGF
jgi:DNA-binding response OmpR family regulator